MSFINFHHSKSYVTSPCSCPSAGILLDQIGQVDFPGSWYILLKNFHSLTPLSLGSECILPCLQSCECHWTNPYKQQNAYGREDRTKRVQVIDSLFSQITPESHLINETEHRIICVCSLSESLPLFNNIMMFMTSRYRYFSLIALRQSGVSCLYA